MRSVIAVTLDGLRSTRCSSAIKCTVTVMLDNDPTFVGEGDIDATREIVEKVENAELFLYPGDQHYFADSSLPSYDADSTALLTKRVLEFLDRV